MCMGVIIGKFGNNILLFRYRCNTIEADLNALWPEDRILIFYDAAEHCIYISQIRNPQRVI